MKNDNKLQDIRGRISIRELNDIALQRKRKKPSYVMLDSIHKYKYISMLQVAALMRTIRGILRQLQTST